MHKGLLIWNIVLTGLLLTFFLVGCMETDTSSLQSGINANRELISQQSGEINNLKEWNSTIPNVIQEYTKQYVDWWATEELKDLVIGIVQETE